MSRIVSGLGLAVTMLARGALAGPPLGRILWTQREGGEFSLQSRYFLPPGLDRSKLPELPPDGVVRLDPAGRIAATGTEARATGRLETQAPAAELRFMHPILDAAGTRPIWVQGRTWGPRAAGGSASDHPVDPGTLALVAGREAEALTHPAEEGGTFDAFPAGVTEDGVLYFARFFYSRAPGARPGFYLMAKRPGVDQAEPVLDAAGGPVLGYEPQLSPDERFLFYVLDDPDNVGSDLWVLPLEPRGQPFQLVAGEGSAPRPVLGTPVAAWMDYAKSGGKTRISGPSLSGDGAFLVFASDEGGDFDLRVAPLVYPGPGQVALGADPVPVADSAGGEWAHDSGPSASGDGAWIACMSDRKEAAGETSGPVTRIWLVRNPLVESSEGPAWQLVPGQKEGAEGLWPRWEQDEDPPHLQVEIRPQDGSEPTIVRLLDLEPDRRPGLEPVALSVKTASWHPESPAPGAPARPDLGSVAAGFDPADPPLVLGLRSVRVLLAGRDDPALGLPGLASQSGPDGRPSEHPILTRPDFFGLQTFDDVRLGIRIRARDDRWLRTPPAPATPGTPAPSAYDEARAFPDADPRALADPRSAPWFPTRTRAELEAGLPGLAWWVEERDPAAGPSTPPVILLENSEELVFRSPNAPRASYPGSPQRTLVARAQDLLGNRTELLIPIQVRNKAFTVQTIEVESRRQP